MADNMYKPLTQAGGAGGMVQSDRMTAPQEDHLSRLKTEFTALVDAKYRKGQKEHGGDLYQKQTHYLLDMAIDEAIDQVVYLLTLREQLRGR